MLTIRTTIRVLFAAAVLAVIGTAQAAEKPKRLVPHNPRVQEELKIKSKPGIQAAASSNIILTNATVCDVRTLVRSKMNGLKKTKAR